MEDAHGHSHTTVDREVAANARGLRAIRISVLGLGLTAALQLGIHAITGSVSLFADALHNVGDVAGTGALWVGFRLAQRGASERFTYGWRRAEDVAGLFIVLAIAVSAALAIGDALVALIGGGHEVRNPAWAFVAALVGVVGNEAVAVYKLRVGRDIGSMALQADGRHARVDGLVSLAAAGGVAGAWAGWEIVDPLVGLGIGAVIVRILWHTGREVLARNLDAVDHGVIERIRAVASAVDQVAGVHDIRARHAGHSLLAQLHVEVDGQLSLEAAHAIGEEVRHVLFHALPDLVDLDVHLDPAGDAAEHHGLTDHHFTDGAS